MYCGIHARACAAAGRSLDSLESGLRSAHEQLEPTRSVAPLGCNELTAIVHLVVPVRADSFFSTYSLVVTRTADVPDEQEMLVNNKGLFQPC
jgi:hypothetical protein